LVEQIKNCSSSLNFLLLSETAALKPKNLLPVRKHTQMQNQIDDTEFNQVHSAVLPEYFKALGSIHSADNLQFKADDKH
jgi:hypothetical protein